MNLDGSTTGGHNFQEYFREHPSFRYWEGLYHQSGLAHHGFEHEYTALRVSEGRMLPDAIVKTLPYVPRRHPLHYEWTVRRRSAEALRRYLKKINPSLVLEIGCGNGWLTNFLADQLDAECCGVDINEIELKQAVRLFANRDRITFVYGDVMSEAFDACKADVIVCASVIQYFADLQLLIRRLGCMLRPGGQIHIIDSPLYRGTDLAAAKARSVDHFTKSGHPTMASYYYHHSWESLNGHQYAILYDPDSSAGRVKRWLGFSPFPWIVVHP